MASSEFRSVYVDIEMQTHSCDEKALVDNMVGHPERIALQINEQPS
jgi:hypothetical protein